MSVKDGDPFSELFGDSPQSELRAPLDKRNAVLLKKLEEGTCTPEDWTDWFVTGLANFQEIPSRWADLQRKYPLVKEYLDLQRGGEERVMKQYFPRGEEGIDFQRYLATALLEGDRDNLIRLCDEQIREIDKIYQLIQELPIVLGRKGGMMRQTVTFPNVRRLKLIYEELKNFELPDDQKERLAAALKEYEDKVK